MSAYLREHSHKERVAEKKSLIAGLKDLIATKEAAKKKDWRGIFKLCERLKVAERQLSHMRP